MTSLVGCGGGDVMGQMSFVVGGTAGPVVQAAAPRNAALVEFDEYIVSPTKAKVTFTSVEFRDQSGDTLGTSSFTDCIVTYDRTLDSGSPLLDCPVSMPVGELFQIAVYFDKTMQMLVSDDVHGIYSDPSVPSGFTATQPPAGADFVSYTIMIGDGASRATPIVFSSPILIAADSAPQLYVTTDMVQTFQLAVDAGGTTLTAGSGNDPVALFGGLSSGSSRFYSNAGSIESYKVGSINDYQALRIFYDDMDLPLFLMAPHSCGPDGPKAAWASPPIAGIGGWLGADRNNVIAWALPTSNAYDSYGAYYRMSAQAEIGQSTTLDCKETDSPPPPADGLTYASEAPEMPSPTTSSPLTLLTR